MTILEIKAQIAIFSNFWDFYPNFLKICKNDRKSILKYNFFNFFNFFYFYHHNAWIISTNIFYVFLKFKVKGQFLHFYHFLGVILNYLFFNFVLKKISKPSLSEIPKWPFFEENYVFFTFFTFLAPFEVFFDKKGPTSLFLKISILIV